MNGKILVVEDDRDAAEALSIELGAAGYVVLGAASMAAARERARTESPDLIVLDLGLPDGDGLELLEQAKVREVSPTPIIVVTARGAPQDLDRCMRLGAADFLQKPVPRKWLLQAIEKALVGSRYSGSLSKN